jgi:hypothetical protein
MTSSRTLTSVLAGLLATSTPAPSQDAHPPGTYAHAITALDTRQLEAWLQRHLPGLVTYGEPTAPRPIDPGTRLADRSQIEYGSTTFRTYTWTNCTLLVEEAREEGTWLVPPRLHQAARVAMTDVDSVSAGVTDGEGSVGLHLRKDADSNGNAADGRSVRLIARYPLLVSRVLLRYTEMCKGHLP